MLTHKFTHYTRSEGGGWFELNGPCTISSWYLRSTPPRDNTIRLPDRELYVYALREADGRVWDAINGWRP